MSAVEIDERPDRVVAVLNRPDQRNAIDSDMVGELHDVCRVLEEDPRPLILVGRGEHFAGGADIAQLRERTSAEAVPGINRTLFDRIARLPMPTVAAVSGYALGGGAELAYACDLRIATTTAVFGNPEPGLGIIAAAGATYRLPRLVGESVAKQVLLAGRRLDASEAFGLGLVMSVTAPGEHLAAAHALVDSMNQQSLLALRLTKLATDRGDGAELAADLAQAVLFDTDDKHRRMTDFLEKRRA